MPPTGPPTEREICTIARRTINIIQSNISSNACLFGSAACYLWADIGRVPNDIDIVVTEDYYEYESLDPEEIKEAIVEVDDRYFLRPSSSPSAMHRILYCRLPGWKTDRRCVKVDILVPPTLGLPEVLSSVLINGISVMPLFDLLVMKTKGWWDHCTSPRRGFRAKEPADVSDIYALLDCAKDENVSYRVEANRHQDAFMDLARVVSRKFVGAYGRSRQWKRLGFPV